MIRVLFYMLSLGSCSAVIYHLNDSEYQRMPPVFFLDDYEACLVEEGSTYCVLQLKLYAEPGNQLMRTITEYSDHKLKHYNHSVIDRGVCVRKTCQNYINSSKTTEEISGSLEACLNASLQREYGVSARLSTLYYCDRHSEPRHIDGWDWAVLAGVLGLVTLNIVGSSYDYIISKQSKPTLRNENAFLLSFSVHRNWRRLTNTETKDPRMRDLKFLNGFRVILNLLTIYMHALMSFTIGFAENPHDIEKAFDIPGHQLFFGGMMVVQLFFFISGFLVVFHLRIEEHKLTFTIWDIPKIMLQRLSRLVPPLAITLALSTSWVRHAGSGPLWNMFVSGSLVADCRGYWWRHLLFYNNYLHESKFCLVQTWQLAAEMQVFLVSVTAYIMTRGRARRVVLGGLLVIGAAAPALHTLLQDLDAVFVTPESFRTLDVGGPFWLQHAPGHTNLPCFIMGMITATRLYDLQKKGSHNVKSRWYTVGQYVSIGAFPAVLYSGAAFYTDGPRPPLHARAAYSLAGRVLLGLAGALSVSAFFMNTPSYIKSLFEWRLWVVPSRLTYCVFLLHMVLVNMIMGARTQLSYFSFFPNIVCTHIFIVVVSYVVAVPFSLMVEAPFIMLFKSLARKETSRSTSGKNGTSVVRASGINGTLTYNGTANGVNRTSGGNEVGSVYGTLPVNKTSSVNGISIGNRILPVIETSSINRISSVSGNPSVNGNSPVNGTLSVNRIPHMNGTLFANGILPVNRNPSLNGTSFFNGLLKLSGIRKEKKL